jgi:Uma2 family endonuclease
MSPATNQHGLYQARIVRWLSTLLTGGEPLVECGIQTAEGVKVADVAWGSTAFFKRNCRANPYQEAPEIVVEILSPSNTTEEMNEKKAVVFRNRRSGILAMRFDRKPGFFQSGWRVVRQSLGAAISSFYRKR